MAEDPFAALDAAYTILIEECGAPPAHREDFRHAVLRWGAKDYPFEYRFGGNLGMGGKFWITRRYGPFHDRWDVTCYREDETPGRKAMIERANARLAALWEAPVGS